MKSTHVGLRRVQLGFLVAALLVVWTCEAAACTNVLVSRGATAGESTFVTYSCDGGVFASVEVIAGGTHDAGSALDVYGDTPTDPADADETPVLLGAIPQVAETYRLISVRGGADFYHLGGMNQWGVSIAETSLVGGRPELENPHGMMAPFSAHPERSLMTLALARAKTARDAIRVIGELAETYGYSSPFPIDGEQFAISDGTEVWSMEIFGPGSGWAPGCGRPGAVWCAQRVPDGHVAVSANRSRIGRIDLADADSFMASSNVYELAESMGWWDPAAGEPLVWYAAFAPNERWGAAIREWRVLSLVAPALGLRPEDGRFPFSVRAERRLAAADLMAIQRDLLAGTPYDVMRDPAFLVEGELSLLACPQGSAEFYALLGITPHRTISNRASSFSCLYETCHARPEAARGCAWYAFGPAATSCYVPIYSGTTRIPERWSRTDLATAGTALPFWTMTLAGELATHRWQVGYPVIAAFRDDSERLFLTEERDVIAGVEDRPEDAAGFLNALTAGRMADVERALLDVAEAVRVACFTVPGDHLAFPPPAAVESPLDGLMGSEDP